MAPQPYQDSLSFGDVLLGMLRRWPIILLCLAAGIALGYLVNTVFKPRYETLAYVMVEKRELLSPIDKTTNNQSRIIGGDDREVASQVGTINSSETIERVIRKLNLTERPEFALPPKQNMLSRLLVDWGFRDDLRILSPENRLRIEIKDKLSVYAIPSTSMIGINFESTNAQLAADIANAFGDVAILGSQELQEGSAGRNRQFLANQVELLREKVTEAEAKAETYRAQNDLTEGERATVNTQKVTEIGTQITQAEVTKSEADAKLREIKRVMASPNGIDAASEVLASTTVQGLATKLIDARSKLSELSATYLDRHPRIIAVKNDIRDLERQIRRETQKIAQSLEGQAKIADTRLRTLRNSLQEVERKAGALSQKDVKLRELERDATASRKQLEDLLARLAEANASQVGNVAPTATIRFIERAQVPSSITFPRKGPIYLLAGLGGLFVGLGLAFLLALLGAAKNAGNEFARSSPTLGMPPVEARPSAYAADQFAATSHSAGQAQRLAVPDLRSTAPQPTAPSSAVFTTSAPAPAPATVQTNLQPRAPSQSSAPAELETAAPQTPRDMDVVTYIQSTIEREVVEGSHPRVSFTRIGGNFLDGAGATMATARAMAANGKKVLVIDGDRLGRSVEAILGIGEAEGISNAVAGSGSFTRIVARDPGSKVHLIRYGTITDPNMLVTIAQRLPAILQSMSDIYDVIILNGGTAGPDILPLLKHFPIAFLLSPKEQRPDVTLAADTLVDNGIASVHYLEIGQKAAVAA